MEANLKRLVAKLNTKVWLPWAVAGLMGIYLVAREFYAQPVASLLSVVALFLFFVALGVAFFLKRKENGRQPVSAPPSAVEQDGKLREAYHRLEAIYNLSQRFLEAREEKEIIEAVLRFMVTLTAAHGASFVPLDEYGQPYARLRYGETTQEREEVARWFQSIVTPEIRDQCLHCERKGNFVVHQACPLMRGAMAQAEAVFCLEVTRGEHHYGVLNLYVADTEQMDDRTLAFVRTLVDEMALGLENLSMRRREVTAAQQIRSLRGQTGLQSLLKSLLLNMAQFLEAEVITLRLRGSDAFGQPLDLTRGNFSEEFKVQFEKLIQDVIERGEEQVWERRSSQDASGELGYVLMAFPLTSLSGAVFGVLLLGGRPTAASREQLLPFLRMLAGHLALIVENARRLRELEYEIIFQERKNLAREIHDGLAQTLGFVKLQMAQLGMQLEQEDFEQVRDTLKRCYQAVSEAYLEARQTIDGLRLVSSESGVREWLRQTIEEFEELSGIPVEVEVSEVGDCLPPEVHAQLMRIVQEALNNVRKHARASHVWITCTYAAGEMFLIIRDNGKGFLKEEVRPAWQHGLQGMRERAALIGAHIEIESAIDQGTCIEVRLPLPLHMPKEVVR